jgi:hypothetical protein
MFFIVVLLTIIVIMIKYRQRRADGQCNHNYICDVVVEISKIIIFGPFFIRDSLFFRLNYYFLLEVCWQPPIVNWLKCNIDGAAVSNLGSASCGGVFRNHSADFIFGFAEPLG